MEDSFPLLSNCFRAFLVMSSFFIFSELIFLFFPTRISFSLSDDVPQTVEEPKEAVTIDPPFLPTPIVSPDTFFSSCSGKFFLLCCSSRFFRYGAGSTRPSLLEISCSIFRRFFFHQIFFGPFFCAILPSNFPSLHLARLPPFLLNPFSSQGA